MKIEKVQMYDNTLKYVYTHKRGFGTEDTYFRAFLTCLKQTLRWWFS